MPQKMRRVPEEAFLSTARIFRTVGGPLRYRILRMPEKRRALPALNASSDRKEKGMARNMTRNAAASKKITAATPKTQTPSITSLSPQLHTQPHTRPIKSTTNTKHHQHPQSPPQAVRKVRFSKCNRLLGHSGRGRTNRRGTFRTGSPTGTKKEAPTECYFNRDFRKAAAAYSPTWWGSTIGASELNFSVRYGKRWILTAITAAVCYLREISRLKSWLTQKISGY